MVWYGMVWYGMVWYGMVWYGMVWYGIVWYGMVLWTPGKLSGPEGLPYLEVQGRYKGSFQGIYCIPRVFITLVFGPSGS